MPKATRNLKVGFLLRVSEVPTNLNCLLIWLISRPLLGRNEDLTWPDCLWNVPNLANPKHLLVSDVIGDRNTHQHKQQAKRPSNRNGTTLSTFAACQSLPFWTRSTDFADQTFGTSSSQIESSNKTYHKIPIRLDFMSKLKIQLWDPVLELLQGMKIEACSEGSPKAPADRWCLWQADPNLQTSHLFPPVLESKT